MKRKCLFSHVPASWKMTKGKNRKRTSIYFWSHIIISSLSLFLSFSFLLFLSFFNLSICKREEPLQLFSCSRWLLSVHLSSFVTRIMILSLSCERVTYLCISSGLQLQSCFFSSFFLSVWMFSMVFAVQTIFDARDWKVFSCDDDDVHTTNRRNEKHSLQTYTQNVKNRDAKEGVSHTETWCMILLSFDNKK